MDALKRAEKARQAEAERAEVGGQTDVRGMELSLDPIEEPGEERAAAAQEAEDTDVTPPPVEALGRGAEARESAPARDGAEGAEAPEPDAARPKAPDLLSLSLDYADIPLDDTQATLPSVKWAQRSVQDYFDGSRSQSLSMDDVREALERAREPEPAEVEESSARAEDTSPRRQAQSIIDAAAPAPRRLRGARVAVLALVGLLLAGAAGALYVFKDPLLAALLGNRETLLARRAPAARSTEQRPAPPAVPAREPPTVPRDNTAAAATGGGVAATVASAAPVAGSVSPEQPGGSPPDVGDVVAPPDAAADVAPAAAPATQSTVPTVAPRAQVAAAPGQEAPAPRDAPASGASTPREAPYPEASARQGLPAEEVALEAVLQQPRDVALAAPPALRISRSRAPGRTHARLTEGYRAFSEGNDVAAMAAYRRVLKDEPRNRDALLGVAALHMRAGALEDAAGYYLEVLRRNPRDAVAHAALLALREEGDPVAAESRVKGLLSRDPRDPYLQFSLGNLYARQGRWPEAQKAYFAALRDDPDNPDYAFNMAVSLDRLGQGKAALTWYRRARELAVARPAVFDDAGAARRIAALDVP
jgi:tetratricopeptide (TPR) repeat protein